MSSTIIRTPSEAHDQPQAMPTHDDGSPYRVMAIYEGGWLQVWADEDTEAAATIIGEQYAASSSPTERAELRLQYLARAQVRAMAMTARDDARFEQLPQTQQELWLGQWSGPLSLDEWIAPLPLPLIRQWYQPIGLTPAPTGNLTWLDAASDTQFLVSLAQLGAITLRRRDEQKGQ